MQLTTTPLIQIKQQLQQPWTNIPPLNLALQLQTLHPNTIAALQLSPPTTSNDLTSIIHYHIYIDGSHQQSDQSDPEAPTTSWSNVIIAEKFDPTITTETTYHIHQAFAGTLLPTTSTLQPTQQNTCRC